MEVCNQAQHSFQAGTPDGFGIAPSPEGADEEIPIPVGFRLQSGDVLQDRVVRLRAFGPAEAPQIVVLGGISAGRDVCGERGWWRETLLDEKAIDLRRSGVIGFDFAPLEDQRVRLTPHDQARLIEIALDARGVRRLHAFIGASYGGMVGYAFAAMAPQRLERLMVIGAAHRPTAQASAWRGVQRRIVEFGLQHGDAAAALSLARQLAMITYRSAEEFEERFGSGVDADGRGAVDRYLMARGAAYTHAMPAQRWHSLSEAIDRFAVDPATIVTPTTLVACPTDQIAPLAEMKALASRLPRLRAFHELPSVCGHDAFLKEPRTLAPLISQFLKEPAHG